MSGSTIGGVIGGVIGFYVGGPQGAQWGWMIGSAIGGYVDPDVIKGPKLTDPQQQTAAEGVPIPLIYGMGGVMGTIIQCQSVPTEHKHKERAGKGGPVQETFTYTRTVAIAICQAAPLGGTCMLRRAWVNGKLAYDATGAGKVDAESAKFLEGMTFYSGSETQLPDPDLEALPAEDGGGVGNVPAYRGTCYAVLPDCDVTQGGGAVPTIKWEIVSHGTETVENVGSGSWIATDGVGNFNLSGGTDWTTNPKFSASANGAQMRAVDGRLLLLAQTATKYSDDKGSTWSDTTIIGSGRPNYLLKFGLFGDDFWAVGENDDAIFGDGATMTSRPLTIPHYAPLSIAVNRTFQVMGCANNVSVIPVEVSTDFFVTHSGFDVAVFDDITCCVTNGERTLVAGQNSNGVKYTDDGITWSSLYTLPTSLTSIKGGAADGHVWVIYGVDGMCVSNDNGATFSFITLPEDFSPFDVQIGNGLIVAVGEKNAGAGTARIWTATTADPFTWTNRPNNFGLATIKAVAYVGCGDGYAIPDAPGMIVHKDGTLCTDYETHTVTPDGVDLADVTGDLIARGFVADYDVSSLSGTSVTGYTISQPTTSGAALQELQRVYFFDLPEWGNSGDDYVKLRAVPRGSANVFAITDDDLVDVDDDEDTRAQQVERARVVNVIASDPDHAYEPIKQTSERYSENVKAETEATFSTAALFSRDELSQRADIFQKIQWTEADGTLTRTLPEEFTPYVPSDCGTVNGKRYRLQKTDQQEGTVQWELVRDRPSAYTSSATGSTGVAVPDPVSFILGPTMFQALNLPRLNSADASPGMYIFVSGLFPAWAGCDLYLSVDGGATEQKVATILNPATMGWLTADIDSGATLSVLLTNDDDLDDATDDQISARFNACAVTTDAVSEIMQFKDAADTGPKTYDLTTLYRGELGTAEADHFTNDDFAMLDGSQVFLPLDASLIGKQLIFRPVTRGTVPANNDTYTVTFQPQFTGPEEVNYLLDESGNQLLDEDGAYLLQE